MTAFVGAAARFLTRVAAVFLLAMVAFLAIPEAFLRDRHITIELIDQIVPARAVGWLRVFGTSAALVFVGLLAWHMVQPALDYVEFNEITMDLQLPLIWKAVLILTGIAGAVMAVLVIFLRDLSRALGDGK